jgi:histone H3/H4
MIMHINHTAEERKLMALLPTLPIDTAARDAMLERLKTEGLSEELADEIHQALTALPAETPNRAVFLVELRQLHQSWRMTKGARGFKRNT